MKVYERLRQLDEEIERIKELYCECCQEYDCDMCPYKIEVQE